MDVEMTGNDANSQESEAAEVNLEKSRRVSKVSSQSTESESNPNVIGAPSANDTLSDSIPSVSSATRRSNRIARRRGLSEAQSTDINTGDASKLVNFFAFVFLKRFLIDVVVF